MPRSPATTIQVTYHAITYEQSFKTKYFTIAYWANIDLFLFCKLQRLVLSERCATPLTDGMTHTQTNYCIPCGSAHRGIKIAVQSSGPVQRLKTATKRVIASYFAVIRFHCIKFLTIYKWSWSVSASIRSLWKSPALLAWRWNSRWRH